jgi:hypothetical protein
MRGWRVLTKLISDGYNADWYKGATLKRRRRRKGYAMGNELDAYVYDYDTRGDNGCPLLVLTCHRPWYRQERYPDYGQSS